MPQDGAGTDVVPGILAGSTGLPRLPRVRVPRPRLERRLEQWAPLTIVRAPPGYGKTVLVGSWLEAQVASQVVPIWVRAGDDLDGREPFWGQLVRHLSAAGSEPFGTSDKRSAVALRSVFNSLLDFARGGNKVALVVDNFERIGDDGVTQDLVDLLQSTRQLHLFVCSRSRHQIEAVAAGRVDAHMVTDREMLLDRNEIALLGRALGKRLSEDDLAALQQALGGWAGPTRLVLEASHDGEFPWAVAASYIANALAGPASEGAEFEHLMQWSLSDHLDADLVSELWPEAWAGRGDGASDVHGLLAQRHRDGETTLTLPTIVHAALRDLYSRRYPCPARELHKRVAKWFASHQGPSHALQAMRHAVAGQDWPTLARVLAEQGEALWQGDSRDAMWRLLSEVPEAVADEYPVISVGRELLRTWPAEGEMERVGAARRFLEVTGRIFQEKSGSISPTNFLQVGTAHLVALRLTGDLSGSERFGAELAQRLEGLIDMTEFASPLAWFYAQRGMTETLLYDTAAAIASYQNALEHSGEPGANQVSCDAAANLALVHAMRGEASAARKWLHTCDAFEAEGRHHGTPAAAGKHLAAGILALDELDDSGAQSELERIAETGVGEDLWPFAVFLRSAHAIQVGRPFEALGTLEGETRPLELTREGAPLLLPAQARADMLTAVGDGQLALVHTSALDANNCFAATKARIYLLAGDYNIAAKIAARALAEAGLPPRSRLELTLVAAGAALRADEQGHAKALFRQALGLHRQSRVLRAFLTVPAATLSALTQVAGEGFDPADSSRLRGRPPFYPELFALVRLSPRERAVLACLERTGSRQEIAKELYVSLNTVKSQLRSLYRKLGTTTREETLARAEALRLLPPGRH